MTVRSLYRSTILTRGTPTLGGVVNLVRARLIITVNGGLGSIDQSFERCLRNRIRKILVSSVSASSQVELGNSG